MAGRQDYDWDKIGTWVIEQSGNASYRNIAEMSGTLVCFGYRKCSHELIREIGKERSWFDKRARFKASQHGGILEDYKRSYEIITHVIHSDVGDLSPAELSSLVAQQIKLGTEIMAINPPSVDDSIEIITRDDVLSIVTDVESETVARSIESVVEMLAEETPVDA